MPLPIAAIAALGFVQGGGLQGIIGGGQRKREEGEAKRKQREAERNYFNFDYNQDVGPIKNIYAEQTQQQQEYLDRRADQSAADAVRSAQQQRGGFGATQAILQQRTATDQANAQRIQALRQQGATFVEQQRQARIAQRYDQAATALGRADHRLAAATRARQQATESLFKGIGAGVAAGAGAASAGPDASFGERLKASGLVPAQVQGSTDGELEVLDNNDKPATGLYFGV